MTEYLPIVFIHTGYSLYLEYSLRQAKHTNPDSEIILLGDESNNRFPFVTHVNIKDYFQGASEFAKIYKHYSTNPYNYELFCFQRWFILEEYLQQTNHEVIMVSDSDVMLYSDITKVYKEFFKDYDICALFPSQMEVVNIAICYLKTKTIKEFNFFMISSFSSPKFHELMRERWKKDVRRNKVGAVSDMTLITDFFHNKKDTLNLASLNEIRENSAFDNSINQSSCFYPNEYDYILGKKKIRWDKDIPFCFNITKNKLIKFHCLHLQGPAKYLMAYFYKGKSFHGKMILDIKFKLLNVAAFWYKTLGIRYRLSFIFNFLHRS